MIYTTSLRNKTCTWCGEKATHVKVSDENNDRRDDPVYGCARCLNQVEAVTTKWDFPQTWAGEDASGNYICTYLHGSGEGYCGAEAAVFVIENEQWNFDCLCSDHYAMEFDPERLHHAREEARRARKRAMS